MKEQILTLLEEIKGKLVFELQKTNALEVEKQQLVQEIESLRTHVAELHMQISYFEEKDAEILEQAKEINNMFDNTPVPLPGNPIPYPTLLLIADTPQRINSELTLNVGNGVNIINFSPHPWSVMFDGVEYTLNAAAETLIGTVDEMNGKIISVKDRFGLVTNVFKLIK